MLMVQNCVTSKTYLLKNVNCFTFKAAYDDYLCSDW